MSSSYSNSSISSGGDYDIEEGDFDEGPVSLTIKPSPVFEPSLSRSHRPRYEEEASDSFEVESRGTGNLSDKEDIIKLSDSIGSHDIILDHNSQDSSVIVISGDALQSLNIDLNSENDVNKPSRKIPIVNKFTTNPDTYDMDYLLDPKIQKLNSAGHRFGGSAKSVEDNKQYSVNFLKKNKEDILKIRPRQDDTEHNIKQPDHSPPRPIPIEDIHQRFYTHIDKVKDKVHKIAEELEQRNKEECTFKPQILSKNDSRRSVDAYVSHMYNYLDRKNAKIKKLTEEKEKSELNKSIEELTFQPSICTNSAKMIQSKRTGPIHERLFEISKQTDRSPSRRKESLNITGVSVLVESRPFIPTVNKASHEIVRNKSIDTLLYEDGLRRVKQQEIQPATQIKKEKFISDRSEKVLIDKFLKEFNETCDEIEYGVEKINYSKFTEILFRMCFIRNDSEHKHHSQERQLTLKLWKQLGGESDSTIQRDTIKYTLLSIMNYVLPTSDPLKSSHFESKDSDVSEYLANSQEGNPPAEVKKLHNRYMALYETRVSKTHKSYLNRVFKEKHEISFKPKLNQYKSLYTARDLSAGNIKIEDHLIKQIICMGKKKQIIKEELETKQKTVCTFKPEISRPPKYKAFKSPEKVKESLGREYIEMMKKQNDKPRTDRLYELGKVAKEKNAKKEQEEKIKRELKLQEECSFQPKLITPNVNSKKPYNRGIDKSIQRMRKAREASEQTKAAKEIKKDGGLRFNTDLKNQFKSSFDQLSSRDGNTSRSINESRSVANISKRTLTEEHKKEIVTKLDRPQTRYNRHNQKVSKPEAARVQPKAADDSLGNSLEIPSFLTERTREMHDLEQDVLISNIDQSSIFTDSIDDQHIEMVSDHSAPAPLNIAIPKADSSELCVSSIDQEFNNQLVKTGSRNDILDYYPTQDAHSQPIEPQIPEDLFLNNLLITPTHNLQESYIDGELKLLDDSFGTNQKIILTDSDTESNSHEETPGSDFPLNTSLVLPNSEDPASELLNEEEFKSLEPKSQQPIVLKVKLGLGSEIKIEFMPTDNIERIIRLFVQKYNLGKRDASKFSGLVRDALKQQRGY